jgi:hypothetical protein
MARIRSAHSHARGTIGSRFSRSGSEIVAARVLAGSRPGVHAARRRSARPLPPVLAGTMPARFRNAVARCREW